MVDIPFTNLDAQYLFDLGQVYLADGDMEVGIRLRTIAEHLQRLDQRVLALSNNGSFAEGVLTAYERIYSRTNLPDVVATEPEPAPLAGVKVTRIPTGVRALGVDEKPKKPVEPKRKPLDIKINLAALKVKI